VSGTALNPSQQPHNKTLQFWICTTPHRSLSHSGDAERQPFWMGDLESLLECAILNARFGGGKASVESLIRVCK